MRTLGISELPPAKEIAQLGIVKSKASSYLTTARNTIKSTVSECLELIIVTDSAFRQLKASFEQDIGTLTALLVGKSGWKITLQLYLRVAYLVSAPVCWVVSFGEAHYFAEIPRRRVPQTGWRCMVEDGGCQPHHSS